MDKESSRFSLKLVTTVGRFFVVFALLLSTVSFDMGYQHTRDSSRADSNSSLIRTVCS